MPDIFIQQQIQSKLYTKIRIEIEIVYKNPEVKSVHHGIIIILLLLLVYSPFSDRVGLPLVVVLYPLP